MSRKFFFQTSEPLPSCVLNENESFPLSKNCEVEKQGAEKFFYCLENVKSVNLVKSEVYE